MNFKIEIVTTSGECIKVTTPWIEVKVNEVLWFEEDSKTMVAGKMENLKTITITREDN